MRRRRTPKLVARTRPYLSASLSVIPPEVLQHDRSSRVSDANRELVCAAAQLAYIERSPSADGTFPVGEPHDGLSDERPLFTREALCEQQRPARRRKKNLRRLAGYSERRCFDVRRLVSIRRDHLRYAMIASRHLAQIKIERCAGDIDAGPEPLASVRTVADVVRERGLLRALLFSFVKIPSQMQHAVHVDLVALHGMREHE